MIFTPLFISLLAFGIVLFALSGISSVLMWMGVALNAALAAAAAADYILSPGLNDIEVERQVDEKLSLGVSNPVVLHIRNRSDLKATLRVRDEAPFTFQVNGNTTSIRLEPFASVEHRYHVVPPARGDVSFGDIYVRRTGVLRMIVRQGKIPAEEHVKVYPDLTFVRKQARIGRGRMFDGRPRRIFGRGTEFDSLREYHPDDEFRNIDWKASARRGKLISREHRVERSQNVVVMLDVGRTMGISSDGDLTKVDQAVNTAAALSFAAAYAGDQVGLLVFSGEVENFIPPRKGREQAVAVLQALYDVKTTRTEADYSGAFQHLSRRWRKRSLVILITDLIDPDSSQPVITYMAGLARTHLPLCVTLGDPGVTSSAESMPAEPKDAYRKAVARQVLHERKKAIAELESAGVIVVDTDGPSAAGRAVEAYMDIKARGRL